MLKIILFFVFTIPLLAGPLHRELTLAISEGNKKKIDQLIKKHGINGTDKGNAYEQAMGFTPLIIAIYSGKLEYVKYIVSKGADVNRADAKGNLPMIVAVGQSDGGEPEIEIMQYLVSKGAKIDGATTEGWTALMEAAAYNNPKILQFLISNGSDVNAKTKEGVSVVESAKTDEIKKMLRDAGAR